MLKTGPCSQSSKPTKKDANISTQNNLISFLIDKAKKLFQKLKKAFCKKFILQYFDIFKLIKVEIDTSRKVIRSVLYQKDTNKNWHPITNYLRKMQLVKRNFEIYNTELLAIVKGLKIGIIILKDPLIQSWF